MGASIAYTRLSELSPGWNLPKQTLVSQWVLWVIFIGALCFASIRFVRRSRQMARYEQGLQHLHSCVHNVRDKLSPSVLKLLRVDDGQEYDEDLGHRTASAAIKSILDAAASAFTEICGYKCNANIMVQTDEETLTTAEWNTDVGKVRRDGSAKHNDHLGLAWQCFLNRTCQIVNDYRKQEGPVDFRGDNWRHYRSGVITHFCVNGDPIGVFNIDCKKRNVFRNEQLALAMMFGDLCALVYQVVYYGRWLG